MTLSKFLRRVARLMGGLRAAIPLRLLQLPFRMAAAAAASRIPRDPQLVVFGAPVNRFGDNAAYLFLHVGNLDDPPFRAVWISGSHRVVDSLTAHGYASEYRWSWRGLMTCVRAGMYVVNGYVTDINPWTCAGALVLNLWHGVPLKKIEHDLTAGPLASVYNPQRAKKLMKLLFADELRTPDFLLSPSAFISDRCMTSAFKIDRSKCLDLGYPRDDHLMDPEAGGPMVDLLRDRGSWERLRDAEFVVGYFPTWRYGNGALARGQALSLERLSSVVAERGGVLLYKAHYVVSTQPPLVPGAVRIHDADDLHAFLPLCSVVITDYSSISFDFMLTGRPVVYYVPDLEEYKSNRGLYFSPEEMMPGPLIRDAESLYEHLRADDIRSPDPRIEATSRLVWGDYRGGSCAKLVEFIADSTTDKTRRPVAAADRSRWA